MSDRYREVIEHPWSLPASIKQYLDLNSGNDRGRIYRVLPEGFRQPKLPRLSTATTKELVALLNHPNGWHRDTAARLLCERQDKSAAPLLEQVLKDSKSQLARMHALYALDGLGASTPARLLNTLSDESAVVREHAVRLAVMISLRVGSSAQELWKKLATLSNDPDIRVRYELAFSLGDFHDAAKIEALTEIIRHDAGDRWVRAAVLNSLRDGAGKVFNQLIADARFRNSQGGQEFLRQLAGVIGTKNDSVEVQALLIYLQKNADSDIAFLLTRALGDGLQHAGTSLARADPEGNLKPIFDRAEAMSNGAEVPDQTRIQAVQLLALSSFDEAGETLSGLLRSS